MTRASVSLFPVIKSDFADNQPINDLVAVEEPLEIILEYGPPDHRRSVNLAITMRTPGNDLDLVAGFLAAEQLVNQPEEIVSIRHCKSRDNEYPENTAKVQLHPQIKLDLQKSLRHFYINSSCGVCGKTSVDSVVKSCEHFSCIEGPTISFELVKALPSLLREKQLVFNRTGGLHAACLFDQNGEPVWWREDVGRHNAVDKVLGTSFMLGKWPLTHCILLVSGRISFELVQKALRAGIRFMAAIGAPSSLAIELAKKANMTLLGFVSEKRFNIYHGAERVKRSVDASN